jgi:AT hook motif
VTSNADWPHEVRDASLADVKTALVSTLKRVLPAPIMAHASLHELVSVQMQPFFKLDFIADPYGSADVQQKVQRKRGRPPKIKSVDSTGNGAGAAEVPQPAKRKRGRPLKIKNSAIDTTVKTG